MNASLMVSRSRQRHEEQSDSQKHDKQHERLNGRHAPCGERTIACTPHVRIDVPVREVVDDASGRAHHHTPSTNMISTSRVRLAVTRDPQRPQRRPQQQPRADRPIEPGELRILFDPPRYALEERRLPQLGRVQRKIRCSSRSHQMRSSTSVHSS